MVSHGNHEDGALSLAHFVERFRSQPSNAVPPTFNTVAGEGVNTMYFSWDAGLVHYIAISTELWFGIRDGLKVDVITLLKWLEDDLKASRYFFKARWCRPNRICLSGPALDSGYQIANKDVQALLWDCRTLVGGKCSAGVVIYPSARAPVSARLRTPTATPCRGSWRMGTATCTAPPATTPTARGLPSRFAWLWSPCSSSEGRHMCVVV